MDVSADIWPMPRSEVVHVVTYAKGMPSFADAKPMIAYLEHRFRGVNNPEAFELIDSINKHFTEEVQRQSEEKLMLYADRIIKARLGLPELSVSDEEVAAAILLTAPKMRGRRDWAGIYRILVDLCNWPKVFKDFERKVERLNDMGLLEGMPSDKSFDYQGLQQGLSIDWPDTYIGWKKKMDADETLAHRREIATLFFGESKGTTS